MYQRMLRCGAELGSPGGGSGSGGAGGRLALLWIVPLTLSGLLGVAWGASSLGAHHIHHFHGSSKHHSVPIAIYRSPASLRGGHGGSETPSSQGLLPASQLSTPRARFSAPKAQRNGSARKGGAFGCAWWEPLISLKTMEEGWGKAAGVFVERGGRGIPWKGAGERRGAPVKGPFLAGHLGPMGRGRYSPEGHCVWLLGRCAQPRDLSASERRALQNLLSALRAAPPPAHFPGLGEGQVPEGTFLQRVPHCRASEAGGPGTHSTGVQSLLPPPLPVIAEGRKVTEADQPLLGSEKTSAHHPFPHPHTHFLIFLGDWAQLFSKHSREAWLPQPISLRVMSEGCWGEGCLAFLFLQLSAFWGGKVSQCWLV